MDEAEDEFCEQLEDICDKLDAGRLNIQTLFEFLQKEMFNNFLLLPWKDEPETLTSLLRIIVATKYYDAENRLQILEVLDKVLKSCLIKRITAKYMPMLKKSCKTRILGKLFHYIIDVYLMGYEFCLTKMENYESDVHHIITSLKSPNGILLEMTKEKFEELDNIYTGLQKMKEEAARKKAEAQFKNRQFTGKESSPLECFRDMPIIPSPEELNVEYRPYLRSVKIFEPYFDSEHYLDVHFRLLREDLISPLREGIEDMKTRKTKLHCYKNVKIDADLTLHLPSGEYIYYVTIDESQIKLCKKTMKNFSLLCLSSDTYNKEFLLASVVDRDDCIDMGRIGIRFEVEYDDGKIDFSLEYLMVESPAYFEAYRHVLSALQSIPPGQPLPFMNYLVYGQRETRLPRYNRDGKILYDFSTVLTREAHEMLPTTRYSISDVKQIGHENFVLNESQFHAFTHALESEIALIQGPPGTGKSYIGLQLATFLLDDKNWLQWNDSERPLLVVCYTNHALDQFLEGIYNNFNADKMMVRVGSQCRNPILQQFMVHKWRKKYCEKAHRILIGHVKRLERSILEMREHLKQLNNGIACHAAMCFTTKVFTDESMIEWLTMYNSSPTSTQYHYLNVEVIRQLVNRGIKEDMAKEAYASSLTKKKDGETLLDDLFKQIKMKNFFIGMYQKYTSQWPSLKNIDRVMKLGYSEQIAIKLLQNSKMNANIIEEDYRKHPFKLLKPIKPAEDSDDEEEKAIINGEKKPSIDQFSKKKMYKKQNERKQEWKLPEEVEMFCDYIRSAPAMEEKERAGITDIWDLPLQKRWRLYKFWISEAQKSTDKAVKECEPAYFKYKAELNDVNEILDKIILRSAKVIGMTTTAAARYQKYLEELKPIIVIAEEAAEVLEAHIFTSLTTACQHLILIGDHQQLRPGIADLKLSDYKFDVSLFERFVKNGTAHKMLEIQHRMRPEISYFMQQHFYENLLNADTVLSRPHVKGVIKDVMFINHHYPEIYNDYDQSRMNTYEMHYAMALAKYFLQQNYHRRQITILSTYSEQRYNLRKECKKLFDDYYYIRIENVDNYQGEESDIIILSLVRSESASQTIGFLNVKNRVCVALSRAKIGMYVIGNFEYLANYATLNLWSDLKASIENQESPGMLSEHLTTKCQRHGNQEIIKNWKDFEIKCPEGGCREKCNKEMKCGHFCLMYCHGYDMEHGNFECEQKCTRICTVHEGALRCKKLCFEQCEPCDSYQIDEGEKCYFESYDKIEMLLIEDVVEEKKVKIDADDPREAEISFFLEGKSPNSSYKGKKIR